MCKFTSRSSRRCGIIAPTGGAKYPVDGENGSRDFSSEMSSLSSERHVESLKMLRFHQASSESYNPDVVYEIYARCLHLPRMTSLTHLEVNEIEPLRNGFSELSLIASMQSLSLAHVDIEDSDLEQASKKI